MAPECANGLISGSSSTAPRPIACRVEYASNVAAPCCTIANESQLRLICGFSAVYTFTGFTGAGSGMRTDESGCVVSLSVREMAVMPGAGFSVKSLLKFTLSGSIYPLPDVVTIVSVALTSAVAVTGFGLVPSAAVKVGIRFAAKGGSTTFGTGVNWTNSAESAKTMEGGS